MFNLIKTTEDIMCFLDKTNSLHDSYLIKVEYVNDGIAKIDTGHYFNPEKTKLILKILVTSIYDSVVEIEFENLLEWQIKDNQWEITDASVTFNEQRCIVWSDDNFVDMDELKKGSYVIAKSMKWRIV